MKHQQTYRDTDDGQRHRQPDDQGLLDGVEQHQHNEHHQPEKDRNGAGKVGVGPCGIFRLTAPCHVIPRLSFQRPQAVVGHGEGVGLPVPGLDRMAQHLFHVHPQGLFDGRLDLCEHFAGKVARAGIGVDADHRPPVPAPEVSVLKIHRKVADHLSQRNHPLGRRTPDGNGIQAVEIGSFAFRGAGENRDQFILLAIESHRQPFKIGPQGIGDSRPVDTGPARLGLCQLRPEHLDLFHPFVANRLGGGLVQQNRTRLLHQPPKFGGIRPGDAQLDLTPRGRPQDEEPDVDQSVRQESLELLLYAGSHGLDALVVVYVNQDLAIAGILVFGSVRQQESDLPAPDLGGEVGYAFLFFQIGFGALELPLRFMDVGAFRQPEIDIKLRPGRIREKALFHGSETHHGEHKHTDDGSRHAPAETDAPCQEALVQGVKAPVIDIDLAFALFLGCGGLQKNTAQQGSAGDRGQPTERQGEQDNSEQRTTILARGVLGCADGGKCGDGHCGTAQHGYSVLGDHIGGGIGTGHAPLHPHPDAVGDHDGVVHQHPQGDDERSQGDPFQRDMVDVHQDEGAHDRNHQHRADDQAAAQPHKEQQNADHDQNRLDQIGHEAAQGVDDRFGLVGDIVDLDACRTHGLQLLEPLFQRLRHGDDIAALDGRNAHGDGRFSVITYHRHRRILVVALDRGDIAEIDQPVGLA